MGEFNPYLLRYRKFTHKITVEIKYLSHVNTDLSINKILVFNRPHLFFLVLYYYRYIVPSRPRVTAIFVSAPISIQI